MDKEICLRNPQDFDKVESEIMSVLRKYELNLVEAVGVLELIKLGIERE